MFTRSLWLPALFLLGCGGLIEESDDPRLLDEEPIEPFVRPGSKIPPPALGSGGAATGGSASGGASVTLRFTGGAPSGGADTGGSGGEGEGDDDDDRIIDCTGAFEESTLLFKEEGWIPQALAPTRDGLELFYARLTFDPDIDASGQRRLMVRSRASVDEDFGEPKDIYELDGVCDAFAPGTAPTAVDISGDALRLYIGCNILNGSPYPPGPFLVATRPDRRSLFTVKPEPIGMVGVSLGLSKNELEAYGSSPDPTISEVLYYTRDSVDEAFSPGTIIPGAISLKNPEPAADGITLMGVVNIPGTSLYRIAVSMRESLGAPYSIPISEGMPVPPPEYSDHSPALGADCRTLYFLRLTYAPTIDAVIMVAKR